MDGQSQTSGLDVMQQPVPQLPGEAGGPPHAPLQPSHRSCVCLPSSLVPGWLPGPLTSEGQRASGTHNSHSEARPLSGPSWLNSFSGKLINYRHAALRRSIWGRQAGRPAWGASIPGQGKRWEGKLTSAAPAMPTSLPSPTGRGSEATPGRCCSGSRSPWEFLARLPAWGGGCPWLRLEVPGEPEKK